MTTFNDVFGNSTVPPSDYGYSAVTLSANTTFVWPYNDGTGTNVVSKIMEVTASSAGLTLTLPHANEVSTGEDMLFRNVGANSFAVVDSDGGAVATVAVGEAKYVYVKDNSTEAGAWGLISYGSGSSSVDAAALQGYAIKAIGSTLNQSHPVVESATVATITASHRGKVFNYTGGTGTLPLTDVTSLGDDFFFLLRNSGTGTLAVDPNNAQLIDGGASVALQPGESTLIVSSGVAWFTVGLGRSMQYNFTQLVYDVSSGTPFTLSSTEAGNKLLKFIGNPGSTVTVIVPSVVAVYYIYSDLSTAQSITVKTAAGTGAVISQSQRVIAICDGTDVVSAQSAAVSSAIFLTDGSGVAPSLSFASKTNTGLYKSGTDDIGVTVDGVSQAVFTSTGATFPNGISGGTY